MSKEERNLSRCFYEDCSASIYKGSLMCYRHWEIYVIQLFEDDYIDFGEFNRLLEEGAGKGGVRK